MSKFKTLLQKGYFPAQLPPCFTTNQFGERGVRLRRLLKVELAKLPAGHPYKEGPRLELYSVARSSHSRRPIAIPNPIAQLELSSAIADNWSRLLDFFKQSPISQSRPTFDKNQPRAIAITPHSKLHEHRLRYSGSAQYVLRTDISQFFPTLYTHSIPWALHGKEKAKAKKNDPKLLGNLIDRSVQRTQNRQTLGIPIGPDTSHIISEVVGTAMDVELVKRMGALSGYRHVDDFVLFFPSLSDAEKGLSELEAVVQHFELKLNPHKTKLLSISELEEELWPHEILSFGFSGVISNERRRLGHFFEKAFHLSVAYKDEAVIRFALRHLGTHVVKRPNWDLLQLFLLRCSAAYPGAIQDVALIFFTYDTIGYAPDKKRLGESLEFLLRKHLPLGHHSECSWLLWLAIHFKIHLNLSGLDEELHEQGSAILLLAAALTEIKLLKPRIDKRRIRYLGNVEQLYDTCWLASYELACADWMPGGDAYINNDPCFSILRAEKIRFFDGDIKPSPLFKPLAAFDEDALNSDDDLSDSFEFSPPSDTYGVSDEEDEEPF